MPGVFMDMGLGGADTVGVAMPRYGSSPAPSNATEAAFGAGVAVGPRLGGLHPGTPAGFIFWVAIGSTALLAFLYVTAPD